MDINLDIETLSTRPDAVILTVGACKFDPYTQTETTGDFYLRINVDEQAQLGRHIDDNTVAWWGNQAADVRDEALSDDNRVSLEEFTAQLNKFVVGVGNIWCQGPVFDIVILENLYRQLGKPAPWNFWQIRDSRTLFGVHGDPRIKNKVGLHNALDDAKSQASAVQTVYKNLNVQKLKQ